MKRGSGHFEMIVSFAFFAGVVGFLLLVLQSGTSSTTLFDSVLDSIGDDFFGLVGVEMGSVFVSVNYTGSNGCFYFNLSDDVFGFDYGDKGVVVVGLDGSEIGAGFDSSVVSVNSSEDFFRMKISEEFNNSFSGSCGEVVSYRLGKVFERKVVSYSGLMEMVGRYDVDYEGLKVELGVPNVYDFGIVVGELGIEMLPGMISSDVEVLAKDEIFEVLWEDGRVENVRVNFRIW